MNPGSLACILERSWEHQENLQAPRSSLGVTSRAPEQTKQMTQLRRQKVPKLGVEIRLAASDGRKIARLGLLTRG